MPAGVFIRLATFGPFGGANIPRLPEAPFLERFFLESPLPVVGVLLVAAAAGFYFLNRAGRPRRGVQVAAGLAAAAAGVFVLATLVETPREHLRNRNDALVTAAVKADREAVADILAEDVMLRASILGDRLSRERILSLVDSDLRGIYRIENYRILETQAAVLGRNSGQTITHVRVTAEKGGGPFFSWWRLDWRQDADGVWRTTGIEMLRGR